VTMGTVALTWLGQAGFVLRVESKCVVVDPFLSPGPRRATAPPVTPEALVGADLVLCTHEHADHMDLPTLSTLARVSPATRFAVPAPIVGQLAEAGIPRNRVLPAYDGEVLAGVDIRVTVLPSEHGVSMADAYGFGRDSGVGPARFVGYVIELAGVRVYHSGDTTWWDGQDDLLRSLGIHIALLPINGRDQEREERGVVGNLTPEEAALLAARSGADLLIPMHWDTITGNLGSPAAVAAAVESHGLDLAVLIPRRGVAYRYAPSPGQGSS
jgi:L-ascorbate 6-phosphate lactonase